MVCSCTEITPIAQQVGKQKDEKYNYSHSGAKVIKVLKEKNRGFTILSRNSNAKALARAIPDIISILNVSNQKI
ncbi:hypothetical protein SAMN04488522_1011242 [Pedobacter caeni]|uniref:Uncharacterized protein n=1 Tax=Pedobacter caeni TaxID=288992 RepID=A0A1M4WFB2_9SPHI|nr:hypothetical protein SAMN04488522_1011242 [Pedobacter caeni]